MKLATTYQQQIKIQKGVMYLHGDAFNYEFLSKQKTSNKTLIKMFHIINNNQSQKEDL